MIEFSGYISGAAKKFRQIKSAQLLYGVMGCVYLVLTPFAIALFLKPYLKERSHAVSDK